jgi:hypothetical protein
MSQEQPTFGSDVRPLFRDVDIDAMRDAFDLGSAEDVKRHAESILQRLEDGSMPCDQMWRISDVDLFRAWMDHGMPC